MNHLDPAFLFVGQTVIWYPHGDATKEGQGAFVTGVGRENICCSVVMKSRYNMAIKDGVRHVSDERAKQPEMQEAGTWDHTPTTKLLMEAFQTKKKEDKK